MVERNGGSYNEIIRQVTLSHLVNGGQRKHIKKDFRRTAEFSPNLMFQRLLNKRNKFFAL
jgi:hypothetical protein